MDITLSLVCLSDKQIRHVSSNVVFITDSVSTKDFLQSVNELAAILSSCVWTRPLTLVHSPGLCRSFVS